METNGERVYEDLVARGKREDTARRWRAFIQRFEACCGVKDAYKRDDLIKFLALLRREGMKQNTINTRIRALKLLSRIQNWDGGFPRLAMPNVRDSDIYRPAFGREDVCWMIERAKECCSARELSFLAFATVYRLRREEIGTLEVGKGVVKVNTAKGGVVTTDIIPDEIKGYIRGYRGCRDVRYMTRVFRRIVGKVGLVPGGKYYGWHSIRRALATELLIIERIEVLMNVGDMMISCGYHVTAETGVIDRYFGRDIMRVCENAYCFVQSFA
jgi:hypothetical protein